MNSAILLLEGGAFRTLYTAGVLDALMEHEIYLDAAGVSGGALTGVNYISHQPDRSRCINLGSRHDPNYVGPGALKTEKGVIGFHYLFGELSQQVPFHEEDFFNSQQRFVAVATCCETGLPVYFDRSQVSREDFYKALTASSSLPMISQPVSIGGNTYLDGGLSTAIPIHWAMSQGYEKIIVVRTRDRSYRKPPESRKSKLLYKARYANHPMLRANLLSVSERYNRLMGELEELEAQGRIFVIAPEEPVTVTRLESDLSKLQALYEVGYADGDRCLDGLQDYLKG
jgi:predicted patatin/cPLA2 family phospholipase